MPLLTRPGLLFSNAWGSAVSDYDAQCFNGHPSCTGWADLGECTANAAWMSAHCKVT